MSNSTPSNLFRGTRTIGILTLLSRILGFVRDVLIARIFGAGPASDAFFVAFRLPNLLRSLLAEGALTSAFVPTFSHALESDRSKAVLAIRQVSGFLILATSLISILGIFFAPEIIQVIAPGFHPENSRYALCVELTQIMMPYIFFVSLVSMLGGALTALHIYGASALAQVVMNVVSIIAAGICFGVAFEDRPFVLAWSTLLGGLIQLLVQFPALRRAGLSLLPTRNPFGAFSREVLRLMIPAVFGAAVYQFIILLNTLLASTLIEGSVSWLFYADRLAQFPMGIFTIALGSVLLPSLSRSYANTDTAGFSKQIFDSLRFTSFFIFPCAAGLIALAPSIISLLFERGAFDAEASFQTSRALQAYALGLWGGSCYTIAIRCFLAAKDTITPTLASLCTLGLSLIFSLLLMGDPVHLSSGEEGLVPYLLTLQHSLRAFFPSFAFGHLGLALASSIASTLCCFLVLLLSQRRFRLQGWQNFLRASAQSACASALLWFVLQHLLTFGLPHWLNISLGIPSGVLLYAAVHFLMKTSEFQETLQVLRR